MEKSYKKLIMWQKASLFVESVYEGTKDFPKDEVYGLTSQLRRAALSVVLNIVEGYARNTKGDFRRFLDISLGSLSESEYLLELSLRLGYLNQKTYDLMENYREESGRLIWSYRNKIKE